MSSWQGLRKCGSGAAAYSNAGRFLDAVEDRSGAALPARLSCCAAGAGVLLRPGAGTSGGAPLAAHSTAAASSSPDGETGSSGAALPARVSCSKLGAEALWGSEAWRLGGLPLAVFSTATAGNSPEAVGSSSGAVLPARLSSRAALVGRVAVLAERLGRGGCAARTTASCCCSSGTISANCGLCVRVGFDGAVNGCAAPAARSGSAQYCACTPAPLPPPHLSAGSSAQQRAMRAASAGGQWGGTGGRAPCCVTCRMVCMGCMPCHASSPATSSQAAVWGRANNRVIGQKISW